MVTEPGQPYGPARLEPAATAAAAEVTFQVDPGAYWPWVARLRIGSESLAPNRRRYSPVVMPPVQMDGLYVGELAIAITRPVVLSTTAAPVVAPGLPAAWVR